MSRRIAAFFSVGFLIFVLSACGDTIEKTEVMDVRWEGSTVSVGGSCQNHGQPFDEVTPVDMRIDVSVQAVEVLAFELTANASGGGALELQNFGIAEPDEEASFLRASHADCASSGITLTDQASAEVCLDSMRDLVNDHHENPYQELVEALNEREGLQMRGNINCTGSVDVDWQIEMRIWTWQRRDW